jgi:sugar phosphate permease
MINFDKNSVGTIMVKMQQEMGFTDAQKGQVLFAFFIGYAAMQIPVGYLNNKFGSRNLAIFSMLAVAFFAVVSGFGSSISFFILVRFLTGAIAHSGYAPSAAKEVTKLPMDKRTFAQGLLISTSGVAAVIIPLIISPIISQYGWKYGFFTTAVMALIAAAILIFVLPSDKNNTNQTNAQSATVTEKISLTSILTDRLVLTIAGTSFMLNALSYGVSSWIPSFLVMDRGLNLVEQGRIASLCGGAALLAAIGGSFIVGKFFYGKEKQVVACAALLSGISLLSGYFAQDMTFVSLGLFFGDFFAVGAFVTLMSLPVKHFIGHRFGPSYSIVATGGIIGSAVSQWIIGALLDANNGNYFVVFAYLLALGLLAASIIISLPKPKHGGA